MAEIAVIIGFRDWSLDRLDLCVRSIRQNLHGESFDVVISDFGSEERQKNESWAQRTGVSYVYSDVDYWSRSQALNAGISATDADILMCTDADMIFAPKTLTCALQELRNGERQGIFLQCRDLPPRWDEFNINLDEIDWDELESYCTLRPRWGMGGLVVFHRDQYENLRGFDERMVTYAAEDLDFAQRLQWAGNRINWLSYPEARMYHVWHPSSSKKAEQDSVAKAAVERNRKIYYEDKSIIRNLSSPRFYRARRPLVSVIISTFNRAELLEESISSVLYQTFQDFEIIVVDDGSTDATKDIVESFDDDRITYIYQENGGISRARNTGLAAARGKYMAVHDDDDLMVPTRLEASLKAIQAGTSATYGSLINFDDSTGSGTLYTSRLDFSRQQVWGIGPAPGHATWLVDTEIARSVGYDTSISASVDINLATRLSNAGVTWAHSGAVLLMRRQHDKQVTETMGSGQKDGAVLIRRWTVADLSADKREQIKESANSVGWPVIKEKQTFGEVFKPWLPDHLVDRSVLLLSASESGLSESLQAGDLDDVHNSRSRRVRKMHGEWLEGVSWRDLSELRRHGRAHIVTAERSVEAQRAAFEAEVANKAESEKSDLDSQLGEPLPQWEEEEFDPRDRILRKMIQLVMDASGYKLQNEYLTIASSERSFDAYAGVHISLRSKQVPEIKEINLALHPNLEQAREYSRSFGRGTSCWIVSTTKTK